MCSNIWLIHFIHSFWRLFKTLLLRGAPSPVTDKEEGLEGDVKFGRGGHQLRNAAQQADGPTTEKALRCIIAKHARGTKSSPLAALSHSTYCMCIFFRLECIPPRRGVSHSDPYSALLSVTRRSRNLRLFQFQTDTDAD